MQIATIVLTRNEQKHIESFLRNLPQYCDVILLDDSDDNTRKIAAENGATIIDIPGFPHGFLGVKYISALKYAYDQGYEYAITIDSGESFDPQWIHYLLMCADGADIVIAQRRFFGASIRRLYSNIAAIAISLIGPRLKDSTCGFRLYKLSSVDFNTIAETAHAFQIEVLIRMYNNGCTINTASVPYRVPETSTLRLSTFADWFKVYLTLWRELYAKNFGCPVSPRTQVKPVRELLEVNS